MPISPSVTSARYRVLVGLLAGVSLLACAATADARKIFSPTFGDDLFGRSVALAGQRLVVGAPGSTIDGKVAAGAAHLYDLQGTLLWTRSMPPGLESNADDELGFAVALGADRVVVGAPKVDVGGAADAGRAFAFDLDGNLVAELVPDGRVAADMFGFSVAVVGSVIVVGTPGREAGASNAGVVYVFDAQGTPIGTLTLGAEAQDDDAFGYALAPFGSAVLVGAPGPAAGRSGAAFSFDPLTGAKIARFASPNPGADDLFGAAVASAGSTVLVGAPFDATDGDGAGAVYAFANADPGAPLELPATGSTPGSLFGGALAGAGSEVVIGAAHDATNHPNAGAAFLRDVAPGSPTRALRSSFGTTLLGAAVAIDGTSIALGEPGFAGRVHLPHCGDGTMDPGEECDGDDDFFCFNRCQHDTCTCGAPATCGDGKITGRETCDDGNAASCDGCSSSCQTELDGRCGDGARSTSCGEQCDDGNNAPADGCSPQCRFECTVDADCIAASDPDDRDCRPSAACVNGQCEFAVNPLDTPCGPDVKCCDAGGFCTRFCRMPCDDNNLCTDDFLDPATGICTNVPRLCPVCQQTCDPLTGDCVSPPAFAAVAGAGQTRDIPCSPTSGCPSDNCTFGFCGCSTCVFVPVNCDDGDPCTDDGCDLASGCTHVRRPNCCTDASNCDNDCRTAGKCQPCDQCDVLAYGYACCSGPNAGLSYCKGGTLHTGATCEADDDKCTLDHCDDGVCKQGARDTCNDNDDCTTDDCDPATGCSHTIVPDQPPTTCGDECQGERCVAGACTPGTPPCPDGPTCVPVVCDPKASMLCTPTPVPGCCETDADCTNGCVTGRCVDHQCTDVSGACPQGNPCQIRSCDEQTGTCNDVSLRPDHTPCPGASPGDACLVGAECRSGACEPLERCEVNVTAVDTGGTPGLPCARRPVTIRFDCRSFGDGGGTRKQQKRARCVATARATIGGKAGVVVANKMGKLREAPGDPTSGVATLALKLSKGARKELCTKRSLAVDVTIDLLDRRGGALPEISRSLALPFAAP